MHDNVNANILLSFCTHELLPVELWRVSVFVLDEFVGLHLSVASEENKSSHQI